MCTDKYEAVLDAEGNIDLDAIPQDLMQTIIDSMSQNLTEQLFNHYIGNLEAKTPIAVFNAQGEQVPVEEIGLAVEVVTNEPSVDEVVAGIIESARSTALDAVDQALAAIRAAAPPEQETQLSADAVDRAISHLGVSHVSLGLASE